MARLRQVVVPPIIDTRLPRRQLSLLNSLIAGQDEFPVDFYLGPWNRIAMQVAVTQPAVLDACIVTMTKAFFRDVVGEATPGTLGAIRMWTCAILLMTTLVGRSGQHRPCCRPNIVARMGFMQVLHALPIGFDRFLTSETSLTAVSTG